MSLTTDLNDPRLGFGIDATPRGQNEVYLVMSEAERAIGFVRPVRHSYVHVGIPGPKHPLRDLTEAERERFAAYDYAKFEAYPESESAVVGRYWRQLDLDRVGKGCGARTTMATALAETYARNPRFYGATYCTGCRMHRPVGENGEFVWDGSDVRVGT